MDKLSKQQLVLNHLNRYGFIDHRHAASIFNIYTLRDTIGRLRKKGYNIVLDQQLVAKKSPRYRYKLIKPTA